MRNKLLNNNQSDYISKGGVLYKPGEIPALTKEQLTQASLVSKLPRDFPFSSWEGMTTKQQLQQMKYSGLNPQEQWSLLNASAPLKVLNEYNQVQDEDKSREYATRIVSSLVSIPAKVVTPPTPTPSKNPSNNTSLQISGLRQKLNMIKEEYQEKPLGKASGGIGAAVVPKAKGNVTANVGTKSIVSVSRDAMDRKKDEMWWKVNGSPLPYPVNPSATPLPQPGPSPNPTTSPTPNPQEYNGNVSKAKYNWYSSYDEAVNEWAKSFWRLSKDFEHCALVYRKVDKNGNESYTFGETRVGSKGLPPIFQPNVVKSLADLYVNEKIPDATRVGFVHSHPEPPKGFTVENFSNWDLLLKILPGIDYVTLVPYEHGNAEPVTK